MCRIIHFIAKASLASAERPALAPSNPAKTHAPDAGGGRVRRKSVDYTGPKELRSMNYEGSTGFDGKLVIPNTVRNPSGVNRKCFATGMLRFAQHDNAISR